MRLVELLEKSNHLRKELTELANASPNKRTHPNEVFVNAYIVKPFYRRYPHRRGLTNVIKLSDRRAHG